jgi:type I restriction enzyme, R subunit
MNEAETRAELIDPALKAAGWGAIEGSRIRRELIDAEKSDLYDVLAYIAYAYAPMSRRERVLARKSLIFSRYSASK